MTPWYLAHIAGFTLWLGGGLAAMTVGIRGRAEDRPTQAVVVRMLGHGRDGPPGTRLRFWSAALAAPSGTRPTARSGRIVKAGA